MDRTLWIIVVSVAVYFGFQNGWIQKGLSHAISSMEEKSVVQPQQFAGRPVAEQQYMPQDSNGYAAYQAAVEKVRRVKEEADRRSRALIGLQLDAEALEQRLRSVHLLGEEDPSVSAETQNLLSRAAAQGI